ncbi:MAG: hypothetical protein KBS81_00965 [Spirochaetales bacterium]|nr:hypothetical protein [Candidatus Physcosoma equi]
MLELRRIIEFSSRVHTFLISLYSFFALIFILFLYFPVQESLVNAITIAQMLLGWTIFLEGLWIILGSILCTAYSKVLVIGPVVKTITRFALYFVISVILDIFNTLITGGFSYGR